LALAAKALVAISSICANNRPLTILDTFMRTLFSFLLRHVEGMREISLLRRQTDWDLDPLVGCVARKEETTMLMAVSLEGVYIV
jgi:hypothetical protein